MRANAFLPNEILRPYIKCHWVYAAGDKDLTEVLYPSGHLELAINISSGSLTTIIKGHAIKMPRVEILGQLTSHGTLMITKGTTLLITRFYPQASALFFPNPASEFTDDSVDLNEIFNQEADQVYYRIMEQVSIVEKINVLECFLIGKLAENEKKLRKLKIVESICGQLMQSCSVPSIIGGFESRYGFSERYIQKMFLDLTGLTAKSFLSIQRFKKSLVLVQSSEHSLTSIAVECGYYDQSHFIREFKKFTGVAPSKFQGEFQE